MKTPKGCVAIEKHHDRIRLRWTYGGKRFCFALGFPYSAINLKAAEEKARRIELDMLTGHFDITLQKYKQPCLKPVEIETPSITVKDLFQKFIEYKSKSLCKRSIEKYILIHKRLEEFRTYATGTIGLDAASPHLRY